jgi:hypothetical protein
MSFSWPDEASCREQEALASLRVFVADGFPAPTHPAEPDLFARQRIVSGHDQAALANVRILIVGGGGLGSWTALALARSAAFSLSSSRIVSTAPMPRGN